MKHLKKKVPTSLFYLISMIVIFSSCGPTKGNKETITHKPISQSEIIAFQKAYGVSFNAISEAIENNSYYETVAKEHIDKNYKLDEGKVMFKIGHDDNEPYRYTFEGIMSYLIGKNKKFPNDQGIAKDNWRKMEWKNDGIINDDNGLAVVMGKVKMIKDDNDELTQNYTMCLKRNSIGELKLIAHKIAKPCD